VEDGLTTTADEDDGGVPPGPTIGATEEDVGLTAEVAGLVLEDDGLTAVGAALGLLICGGVHRGGAFDGRTAGVCENCGAVHIGVEAGALMTVTVVVAVAVTVMTSCTVTVIKLFWGNARAPTARTEVRRVVVECIVKSNEELGKGSCVL
jgi:mannose/fructose/N-acetylgalactosamine-specific phosphotransferase system component IIC